MPELTDEEYDELARRVRIRSYHENDEAGVERLWNEVFPEYPPWNVPVYDIRRKMRVQRDLFLVGELDDRIVATSIGGFDGVRGWLYRVAVEPDLRRCGIASKMVAEVERRLKALGCTKLNLQVRSTNADVIAFYQRNGFELEDIFSMGKRLVDVDEVGNLPPELAPAAPTGSELAQLTVAEFSQELDSVMQRLEHCLCQLDDAQLWSRAAPELNSIANLILHLCGNLRQWIICGLGGEEDRRDRQSEFDKRTNIPKLELLTRLRVTVAEVKEALDTVTAGELMRRRLVQGFEVTGLGTLTHAVPHFRGHVQEITYMTRQLLGDKYLFAWTPEMPRGQVP